MKRNSRMTQKTTLAQKSDDELVSTPDNTNDEIGLSLHSSSGDEVGISIRAFSRDKSPKVSNRVREFLTSYKDESRSEQAYKILNSIEKTLHSFSDVEFPEIEFFVDEDDDSLNFQWDVGDTTLVFGLETEEDESFWIMLSGKEDRDIRAKGNLDNYNFIIPLLIGILNRKALLGNE